MRTPNTKNTVFRKMLSLVVASSSPLVVRISRTLVPERYARNAGNTGIMHGEKKEATPAAAAMIRVVSIKQISLLVYLLLCPNSVQFNHFHLSRKRVMQYCNIGLSYGIWSIGRMNNTHKSKSMGRMNPA